VIRKRKTKGITVDPNMPDFSQSSFVLKKVENARAFIAKNGLPEGKGKKKMK